METSQARLGWRPGLEGILSGSTKARVRTFGSQAYFMHIFSVFFKYFFNNTISACLYSFVHYQSGSKVTLGRKFAGLIEQARLERGSGSRIQGSGLT